MKLFVFENCPFCKRVELFLSYKSIPFEKQILPQEDLPIFGKSSLPVVAFDDGTIMDNSIPLLREIEYRSPHPIGFVGPVEPKVQWASMLFTSTPYFGDICKQLLLKEEMSSVFTKYFLPPLTDIVEMVEDEYFIMGPTFSVADCILAADMLPFISYGFDGIPTEILSYQKRVFQKCRLEFPL